MDYKVKFKFVTHRTALYEHCHGPDSFTVRYYYIYSMECGNVYIVMEPVYHASPKLAKVEPFQPRYSYIYFYNSSMAFVKFQRFTNTFTAAKIHVKSSGISFIFAQLEIIFFSILIFYGRQVLKLLKALSFWL